jgi:hypothetical protein
MTDPETGNIAFSSEALAGGLAGMAQVTGEPRRTIGDLRLMDSHQPLGGALPDLTFHTNTDER